MVTGSDLTEISSLKISLNATFGTKYLGRLYYFLGFEVSYLKDGNSINSKEIHSRVITRLRFSTKHAIPTATLLLINCKLALHDGEPLPDPSMSRMLIGRLIFFTNVRPDLSYVVKTLSQFMQHPSNIHMMAPEHVLRHIKGTSGQCIILRGSDNITLHTYCDLDWASCPTSKKSVTGYLVLMDQSPISWKSKKQTTISKSSTDT